MVELMDWQDRLKVWEAVPDHAPGASASPRQFAPASESQIAAAEQRLGIALPPSFRSFLLASDGMRIGNHEIGRIWGIEELKWFRAGHRQWIRAYTQPMARGPEDGVSDEEYFSYGGGSEFFRRSHLKETLQISDVGDAAVYLLNPQVISKDGEWEAWFFANWLPGALRYRSFAEMMDAEFHRLARLDWQQPVGVQGDIPDEYVGSPGSTKRRAKKRKKPREQKILGKPVRAWSVEELLAMLARDDYGIIHHEVIQGLALLGDKRAVEPLIAKAQNGNVDAAYALKKLAPELLPEALLEILRRRPVWGVLWVAGLLCELKEMRAVPLIVDVIKDLRPDAFHESEYVAQHVPDFGQVGVDALIALLQDGEATVRRRAAAGLAYANEARVVDALRPLLRDPDSSVREYAERVLLVFETSPARRKKER